MPRGASASLDGAGVDFAGATVVGASPSAMGAVYATRPGRRQAEPSTSGRLAWYNAFPLDAEPQANVPALPLPFDALPEAIKRFANPAAPERARQAAAKGLVPLKGGDLVALLLQLGADPDTAIADVARASFEALPRPVLEGALDAPLHASFLDRLCDVLTSTTDLERLLANPGLADGSVARLARTCTERVAERIALDEQRVLRAPAIIESLYKNKNTRMSTVDRLIELAVRNGVRVEGIATFDAHVEAIQGQLIVEPQDEPLPSDGMFNSTLAEAEAGGGQEPAIEVDQVDGSESVKDKFKPLAMQIADMNLQEKLRMTLVGNAACRAILVRDSNKMVQQAAITSPMMTESEAAGIAQSRQVSEDVLRIIGNRREWLANYEVKRALVFNPKTPVGISMRFLSHLHVSDLRNVSRSRGIPAALKTAAFQRLEKKKT